MFSIHDYQSGDSDHTSRLKSTPPIGAPNATEIPAAAAAESASRFLAAGTIVSLHLSQFYAV